MLDKLIIAVLLTISTASIKADVAQDYEKIALEVLKFDFWNNNKIYCSPHKKVSKTGNPNGDYIVNIASADVVVVFAHGFRPHGIGGEQPLTEMISTWQYHIDLLEEIDSPVSYCVVAWDSEYGFDDPTQTLSKVMHIFSRALSDKRLGENVKSVNYVGYSAGGNYIKYSAVMSKKTEISYNKMVFEVAPRVIKNVNWSDGNAEAKRVSLIPTILTLGTPHLGSKSADSASLASLFSQFYLPLMNGQLANVGYHYTSKAQSRGALQLRSIHKGNKALYDLNRLFIESFPKNNTYAIAGTADTTVSIESANPHFTRNYQLGFEHSALLEPYRNKSYKDFLKNLYTNGVSTKDE